MTNSSASRASVIMRIAAAVVGGYALATVMSIALAGLLPTPRADAVLATTLLSFAVYAAAILWAFAVRTARLAWLGLMITTALCSALAWLVA